MSPEQKREYQREWYRKNSIRLREVKRKWRKDNPSKVQEIIRRSNLKRRQEYRKRIYDYQIEVGGCALCGTLPTQQCNLHFHHLDPSTRLFRISRGVEYTWEEVLIEIQKCIILCASCHNIVEPRLPVLRRLL